MRQGLRGATFENVQELGFTRRTDDRQPHAKVPHGRVRFKGKASGALIHHAGAAHGHLFEDPCGILGQTLGPGTAPDVLRQGFANRSGACKKRHRIDRLARHFRRQNSLQAFCQRVVGSQSGGQFKNAPDGGNRRLASVVQEKHARILGVVKHAQHVAEAVHDGHARASVHVPRHARDVALEQKNVLETVPDVGKPAPKAFGSAGASRHGAVSGATRMARVLTDSILQAASRTRIHTRESE